MLQLFMKMSNMILLVALASVVMAVDESNDSQGSSTEPHVIGENNESTRMIIWALLIVILSVVIWLLVRRRNQPDEGDEEEKRKNRDQKMQEIGE